MVTGRSGSWDYELDSQGGNRTLVVCAVVIPVAVVLIAGSLIVFFCRDRLRGACARWRARKARQRDARYGRNIPEDAVLVNDVALQLQLYALEINDANDGSDHVTMVMPGLLSAMAPGTPMWASSHRRSTGRALIEEGSEHDIADSTSAEEPLTLPGMTIAFGAGASTSFAQSTSNAMSVFPGQSLRGAAPARNPFVSQSSARTHLSGVSAIGASRTRLTPSEARDDMAGADTAVVGEVLVPNVTFSFGYGGYDASSADDDGASDSPRVAREESVRRHRRGRRSANGSSAARSFSVSGGLRGGHSRSTAVSFTNDDGDPASSTVSRRGMYNSKFSVGSDDDDGASASDDGVYGSGSEYTPRPDVNIEMRSCSSSSPSAAS